MTTTTTIGSDPLAIAHALFDFFSINVSKPAKLIRFFIVLRSLGLLDRIF